MHARTSHQSAYLPPPPLLHPRGSSWPSYNIPYYPEIYQWAVRGVASGCCPRGRCCTPPGGAAAPGCLRDCTRPMQRPRLAPPCAACRATPPSCGSRRSAAPPIETPQVGARPPALPTACLLRPQPAELPAVPVAGQAVFTHCPGSSRRSGWRLLPAGAPGLHLPAGHQQRAGPGVAQGPAAFQRLAARAGEWVAGWQCRQRRDMGLGMHACWQGRGWTPAILVSRASPTRP